MSAWGPWSECDAECGTGRMTRTRTIERPPINGGKHCSALVQKRACIGQRCPRDQRQVALRGQYHSVYPTRESLSVQTCRAQSKMADGHCRILLSMAVPSRPIIAVA